MNREVVRAQEVLDLRHIFLILLPGTVWHKPVLPQTAAAMLSPAQCRNRGKEGRKRDTTTFDSYKLRLP